ncbi:major facilitator superfamily permease [Corynebacterium suranareeae]|uniref:Major facilitator superfamily permease n=1 Tax=Corynebacterium suranareeae TaxID=2506452 RepID=A0A160PQS9_9CORY|nr:MFS transporter [Corynebacterium suranareeae]BAU95855.1 major facilitator superfamily permease [Corynebacterium suranareeae]
MAVTARTDIKPHNSQSTPLFTATFILGWLVNLTQYLSFYFLVTVMALYAMKSFAVSETAGGFAASAFVVGATVARIFAGWAADRFGKKQILLIFVALGTVASLFYIPAASLSTLIVVRLIHGFSYSLASTAVMALVQSVIPPSRRAEGTGYFALGSTLATAFGPAVALFVIDEFSYNTLFWITTATSVFGLVLTFCIRKPEHLKTSEKNGAKPAWSIKTVVHPSVMLIGFFMLAVGLAYAGVITFLNGFAQENNLTTGAGLFFIAYAVAMLGMRFFLGRIQDKHGANPVIYFGLVSFGLALVLMALATEDWHIVVAGALTGLGYGTIMPAAQAIAVDSVPHNQVGSGISTLFLFTDIGIGLGPILLGSLVTVTGYNVMYATLAAVIVVAFAFYVATLRKHSRH